VLASPRDALSHSMLLQELPRLRGLHVKNQSFAQALPLQQKIADALKQLLCQFPEDRAWQQALGETYGFLAALHLRLGKMPQAQHYYGCRRALLERLARPSVAAQPEAAYDLAWFLANCPVEACRDPERARALIQHLQQIPGGKNPFTQVVEAAAYNGLGQFGEAARLMEPMAKVAPDQAVDLWINLAIAHHHLDRRELACRCLSRAAQRVRTWVKPLELDRLLLLAEVNRLLGDPEPILTLAPVTPSGQK
jgi:tetratricopeptide (TPR) repeat protein